MAEAREELWTGMVEVRRLPDCDLLRGSAGAFTWIVTWASNSAEFPDKAARLAASLGLYVFEVEREHPVGHDPSSEVNDEIADLINRAEGNPDAILYGTFHTYRHDNA
jgi:hypothetical protein